jgi:4-hydroxythreonine-4-phosphate dehydrogenase
MRPRIGITLGDPAGIGPEIVRAALDSKALPTTADYIVVGEYPDCSRSQPSLEAGAPPAAAWKRPPLWRDGDLDAVVTGLFTNHHMRSRLQIPGPDWILRRALRVKNFASCC